MAKTKITDKKAVARRSGSVARSRKTRRTVAKTQRPVHIRLALHPVTVFALLLVAVFLVGWTFQALAATASTTISATVSAPALTQAATITSPTNAQVFTSSAVTVAGACPTASYVTLTINNIFAGTNVCAGNNTYQIPSTLYVGDNVIKVQDYNVTDQAGPSTPTITVTYAPVLGASTVARATSNPLILTSDFHYQTFSVDEQFDWELNISGGTPPHTVIVDWGDASKLSRLSFTSDQTFHIAHSYHAAGLYMVKARDIEPDNASRILQLVALITDHGSSLVPGFASSVSGGAASGGIVATAGTWMTAARSWLWVAWPTFIVTLLMVISFWLGERQEYRDLFLGRRAYALAKAKSPRRR